MTQQTEKPVCKTCNGERVVGGWSGGAASIDGGGSYENWPCPDCTTPTYDQLSALCAQLPDVADNKWTTPEGAKMAREYATRTRLDLAMMHLSDYELANAQYLCPRESLELGQYQTAAKERIRWLSVQLALQQLKSNALAALCAQMAAALETVKPSVMRYAPEASCREFEAALTAYRTLSPDPQWQKVPVVDEARLQEVHTAIVKYLRSHRLLHIANADSDDDSDHYPLVDQLTSGPTIKEGIEEIENIAEWLTVALRDGGFISGNRARGEG